MISRTVQVTVIRDGSMCIIPVPFDPKAVFGKARAPVKVTINGHTFRSTIFRMGDRTFVPLRKSNREPAKIEGGEVVRVRFEADTDKRVVDAPADLVQALKKRPGAWKYWGNLSYTNQRECAEAVLGAKRPETRIRRIARVVSDVEEKLKLQEA